MDNKKKFNWFKTIMSVLLIAYVALYVLNVSGYYDSNLKRKVEFTQEQIEAFERDVAAGEKVDIKDYLDGQDKDYTNNVSRFGYRLSTNIDEAFNRGLKEVLRFLSKLLS